MGETRKTEFQRLIYGLCFFHGVVLERHRYGPAGWNNRYAFHMSDLSISLNQMQEILFKRKDDEDLDNASLEAIQYLVAECNYGGRITDTHDRRLLSTLLGKLVNLTVASEKGTDLSETAGLYPVPRDLNKTNIIQTVTHKMKVVPHPHGLGLSENSAMVRDLR